MELPIHVPAIGTLDIDLLYRAVEALEFKAHYDEGVSTADTGGLIREQEVQEWEDARILRTALDQGLIV